MTFTESFETDLQGNQTSKKTHEVPAQHAFSSWGRTPTPIDWESLPPIPQLEPEDQIELSGIPSIQESFDLSAAHSSEIRYAFGTQQAVVKAEILQLIRDWHDVRRPHADMNLAEDSVVLYAFEDPVCLLEDIHSYHPKVHVLAKDTEQFEKHKATILEHLPYLRSHA